MDIPKILGDPAAVKARLAKLDEPHVAPLTAFVRKLRVERGRPDCVPYFDPADGGVEAEFLFVLLSPGSKAIGSGFISRNNPDETAKNIFTLTREAGIDRKRCVNWNVVPWYIGSSLKTGKPSALDRQKGLEALSQLIKLLPRLKTVVLMGNDAHRAEWALRHEFPDLQVVKTMHPSPLAVNNRPENRDLLREQLKAAMNKCESFEGETI